MKNKIIWILFVLNSLLLLLYVSPFSSILNLISIQQDIGAIGIIGGADGPTAIFLSPSVNWSVIIMVILEVVLVVAIVVGYFMRRRKA